MALDFPSSPTNGQSYAGYVYDSSLPGWRNINSDFGVQSLNTMGLKNVVPTSVVVASGSATTNSNGTVTFSGSSSVSLNGVFTGTYSAYRVVLKLSASTALAHVWIRLRNAGTDGSGPCYGGSYIVNQIGTAGTYTTNGGGNVQIGYTSSQTTGKVGSVIDIHSPAIATSKIFNHAHAGIDNSYVQMSNGSTLYENSGTFDGLTILPSSGTFTGTLSVYGYTN